TQLLANQRLGQGAWRGQSGDICLLLILRGSTNVPEPSGPWAARRALVVAFGRPSRCSIAVASGRCVATDFSRRSARLRPSSVGARHETGRAPTALAIRPFVAA